MKKTLSLILTIVLLLSLGPFAAAADDVYHSETKYLTDTLTLAGSGFDEVYTLNVADLESLARDSEAGLFYENEYSMLTSGSIFSKHIFTGVKLYDLLLREGLDGSLPDSTQVKFIAKDGYTIPMTLGGLRVGLNRYSAMGGELEESGLPVLAAFASDHIPLIGPTGTESVYKRFDESNGYVAVADNIGGPLRLIVGQSSSYEFNAPNCSKWLAAIVVGDDNGYVYTRVSDADNDDSEPDRTGDWTHRDLCSDYRLTISGTQAKVRASLSLAELEAMTEGTVREYYAASAGRNAYEGVTLKYLVSLFLKEGLDVPNRITVKAADGYAKDIDIPTVLNGVDSFYQPGKHRDLLLAWAIDGVPLVPDKNSEGYDGNNAYGPIRFVVENTISYWVKNVSEIVIGDELPYRDVSPGDKFFDEIQDMYDRGIMSGMGNGVFSPESTLNRAQVVTMLWRSIGSPSVDYDMGFRDVPEETWYTEAVRWAAANEIVNGYSTTVFAPSDPITREQLSALLYRRATPGTGYSPILSAYPDGSSVSVWALEAAGWCASKDYLTILPDGGLHPTDHATRAQAAAALSRFLNEE